MRPIPLVGLTAGINRLRVKGGASARGLYDLVNGWINQEGVVVPRAGTTRMATLDAQTVGLVSIDGVNNVFSIAPVTVPAGFVDNVLVNPNDATQALSKIWFAQPFMGFIYVVAEFANGDIYHYWLQNDGTWAPNTVYTNSNIILPTVPNGFAYKAVRVSAPNPTWSANIAVSVGQIVEPVEYTGYAYKATTVVGATPHTGTVEPTWPTAVGATVQEFGDFSTSVTSSVTGSTPSSSSPTPTPLGSAITDRYGDSATISGSVGLAPPSTATTVTAASSVETWAAGATYAPGSVVRPTTNQGAYTNAIPNGDFEAGNDGNWVLGTGWTIDTSDPYQGNYSAHFLHTGAGFYNCTMLTGAVVSAGQSVTATAYAKGDSDGAIYLMLSWYDSTGTLISSDTGTSHSGAGGVNPANFSQISVTGIAPANAVTVKAVIQYQTGSSSTRQGWADLVSWNLSQAAAVSNFLYEAVQSAAATSGATEPTWPTVEGNEVVDGGVTWQAVGTSIITWTAIPLTQSGATEPTWPTVPGESVYDGNMSWECTSRRITDTNCPNTKVVCLGASHVFCGNGDIVSYSAAVDPTDWTSANNAGYLPTGLNNYGNNPVSLLGLYRTNLMVFNANGFQMWQIDPDPANMAILDAQPVGSIYTRTGQTVASDMILLTAVGVRNVGIFALMDNLQVGNTGQPVDALVQPLTTAGTYDPIGLYYPNRGQYWVLFGNEALVLTTNGQNTQTWSRYIFPDVITDWTDNNGVLYLRSAGNLVWAFDENALEDDMQNGVGTPFDGVVQWPYLDGGTLGRNKALVGVDIVGTGAVTLQMGFDQSDETSFSDNPGFSTSPSVTPPYDIALADTVPGTPIPLPLNAPSLSPILTFTGGAAWSLDAVSLYVNDAAGAGATG